MVMKGIVDKDVFRDSSLTVHALHPSPSLGDGNAKKINIKNNLKRQSDAAVEKMKENFMEEIKFSKNNKFSTI